jgi:hypothetical protein
VKWEITLKPKINIILGANLYDPREESVKGRLKPKKIGLCVELGTYV